MNEWLTVLYYRLFHKAYSFLGWYNGSMKYTDS